MSVLLLLLSSFFFFLLLVESYVHIYIALSLGEGGINRSIDPWGTQFKLKIPEEGVVNKNKG